MHGLKQFNFFEKIILTKYTCFLQVETLIEERIKFHELYLQNLFKFVVNIFI